VQVDPANPDRHMVDRWHEVRTAWIFVAAFGVGCAISLALLVWALRGGINTVGRRV
jgi:hypothetical protein